MITIINKDDINDEDLEYLRELLDKQKEKTNSLLNFKKLEESRRDLPQKSEFRILIEQDKTEIEKLTSEKLEVQKSIIGKNGVETQNTKKGRGKKKKRKKIKKKKKKKDIELELTKLTLLINENNKLLKNLTQSFKSIDDNLKSLTKGPINIKVVK